MLNGAYGVMDHDRTIRVEHDGSLAADLLKGAVAGAAAVWVMDRLDWFAFMHENPRARAQTERVRPGGMDPAHVAVRRAAEMVGMDGPAQPNAAGVAVHYSLGIGPGALYAAMRDRAEGLGIARGPLYGLGLFLIQDEAINSVSGLSARPSQYPWQAHARGLAAHLVYGVVTELALNAMDAVSHATSHASRRDHLRGQAGRSERRTSYDEERATRRDPGGKEDRCGAH